MTADQIISRCAILSRDAPIVRVNSRIDSRTHDLISELNDLTDAANNLPETTDNEARQKLKVKANVANTIEALGLEHMVKGGILLKEAKPSKRERVWLLYCVAIGLWF